MIRLVTVMAAILVLCAVRAAATECLPDRAFCGSEGATVDDCDDANGVAQSCPILCGLCSPTPLATTPKVATMGGDLHLNSSSAGRVLFNGIDLVASAMGHEAMLSSQQSQIQELRGIVATQSGIIAGLTQFQDSSLERLRILELTDAPTMSPSNFPTVLSSSPSAGPTSSPTELNGGSRTSAARTCFTLLASQRRTGTVQDGTFWLDPDGAGGASPTQVVCDMANGGLNVVNIRRQIDVGSRHNDQQTTFTVANFGANAYRLGVVVADFEFAGELDDGNTNVRSWFNSEQISFWRNGRCNTSPVRPGGWPVMRTVNGVSFTLRSRPEGDVDASCGGGIPSHGRNWFTARKVQLIPN